MRPRRSGSRVTAFGFALAAVAVLHSPPLCLSFDLAAYDASDSHASHTTAAIEFDKLGRQDESLTAFQAAARFTPSADTLTNLGVCLMRMRRYNDAYEKMSEARDHITTDQQRAHVDENWRALMQSMRVEGVPIPGQQAVEKLREKRRRREAKQQVDSYPRERLAHPKNVPYAPPLPRVSVDEIDSGRPEFEMYRQRREPFILTGGAEGWKALEDWPDTWQEHLASRFPDAVTDFYPYNMLSTSRQSPYLTRLPRAVREVLIDSGPDQQAAGSAFRYDSTALQGRYMHLQITPSMWLELEGSGDIAANRHWHLMNDDWLETCMGHPDSEVSEEYHLKTHWKIILTGSRGAGMFNHSDSLMTSSWHMHLLGSKWWYVCGKLVNGTDACFEDYLVPGEALYYGPGWYHETQNLETPTMTITDTVAHAYNFEGIADQLHATCAYNRHTFDFSAALCDALDGCFSQWYETHKGTKKPAGRWRPWRDIATPEMIQKREDTKPHHNNYDGRNYITEA